MVSHHPFCLPFSEGLLNGPGAAKKRLTRLLGNGEVLVVTPDNGVGDWLRQAMDSSDRAGLTLDHHPAEIFM